MLQAELCAVMQIGDSSSIISSSQENYGCYTTLSKERLCP